VDRQDGEFGDDPGCAPRGEPFSRSQVRLHPPQRAGRGSLTAKEVPEVTVSEELLRMGRRHRSLGRGPANRRFQADLGNHDGPTLEIHLLEDHYDPYADLNPANAIDPFGLFTDPIKNPQLRGWYKTGWDTEKSKFGKVRKSGSGAHHGVDIYAKVGTQSVAALSGLIYSTGYSDSYGNYLII